MKMSDIKVSIELEGQKPMVRRFAEDCDTLSPRDQKDMLERCLETVSTAFLVREGVLNKYGKLVEATEVT